MLTHPLKMLALLVLVSVAVLLVFPTEHAEADDVNEEKREMSMTTLEALEWDAFSEAASSMKEQYDGIVQIDHESESYRSGRLIVKVNGDMPDLPDFDPAMVIRDKENHYLMQFLSAREAQACAEYLIAFRQIEYVEPDQIALMYDVEEEINGLQTEGLSSGASNLP